MKLCYRLYLNKYCFYSFELPKEISFSDSVNGIFTVCKAILKIMLSEISWSWSTHPYRYSPIWTYFSINSFFSTRSLHLLSKCPWMIFSIIIVGLPLWNHAKKRMSRGILLSYIYLSIVVIIFIYKQYYII